MSEAVQQPSDGAPDFTSMAQFESWRKGDAAPVAEETTSAVADEPAAETVPDSETDKVQDEEAEQPEGDEPEGTDKPKKGGFQRRIEKLVKRNSVYEQQIAELQRRLDSGGQKPAVETAPSIDAARKPKLEDFETLEEWGEALTDWKLAERDRAGEQKRQAEEQSRLAAEFNKRINDARVKYHDFDEVAFDAEVVEKVKALPVVAAAIQRSPLAGELAYALGSDPATLDRIAAITDPFRQAVEIGKLETKLEEKASGSKPKPSGTRAPAPPSPVSARSAAPVLTPEKAAESGDLAAFMRMRDERDRARR